LSRLLRSPGLATHHGCRYRFYHRSRSAGAAPPGSEPAPGASLAPPAARPLDRGRAGGAARNVPALYRAGAAQLLRRAGVAAGRAGRRPAAPAYRRSPRGEAVPTWPGADPRRADADLHDVAGRGP